MSFLVVKVKAGSKKGPLVQTAEDGSLVVYVREPAVDGKANNAVTKLVAKYVGVPKSKVEMVSGKASRTKCFRITL